MSGAPQENVGLRKIGLRRSPAAPDTWDIFVAVHNYGAKPHDVDLELQFGKSPVGIAAAPAHARRGAAGDVLVPHQGRGISGGAAQRSDAFPQDDRALIELPGAGVAARRGLFKEPQLLRPLFASNPQVDADV